MLKMFSTCFKGKPTSVTAIAPPKTIIIAGGSMNFVRETCDSPTINTPTIMAKPMIRPRTVLISIRRASLPRRLCAVSLRTLDTLSSAA